MLTPSVPPRPSTPLEEELAALHVEAGVLVLALDEDLRPMQATPGLAALLGWAGYPAVPAENGPPGYPQLAADARLLLDGGAAVRRRLQLGGQRYVVAGRCRSRADGSRHVVFRFVEAWLPTPDTDWVRQAAHSTDDYAIFTLDTAGCITSWNSAAEQVFGYTQDQVLGRHFGMLFVPEDRAAGVPAEEMRRARSEGRADEERWHLRADGQRFYCSGVLTPLRNGHLHGYAKIARDLTARKRAERAREVLLRHERMVRTRAQTANQLKDEFLAIMSHELKHPLNLIYANAELLTRLPQVQDSPMGQQAARVIQKAVLGQAQIIDDLLDLSRMHTGKLRLTPTDTEWRRVAAMVLDASRAAASEQGVSLLFEAGPPVRLHADEVRLEQIVWNLVSNAIKFTPAGGSVTVRLSLEDAHPAEPDGVAYARLDVVDTGCGIAPDRVARLFGMFTQLEGHTTRTQAGLGIGLALVRQLAELHGGRVQVHSDGEGRGSTFSVWLPAGAGADRAPADAPAPQAAAAGNLAGMRVLLVDDSPETLEAFQQLLLLEGAVVTAAGNGAEALAHAQTEEYDVVVSDIAMPHMNGYEMLERLRRIPRHAQVPALALTGFGRDEDVNRALQSGFRTHLSKPVRMQALLEALVRLRAPQTPG